MLETTVTSSVARVFKSAAPFGSANMPFRVRIDVGGRFNRELLQRLGQYAAGLGVFRVNIVDAALPLKFVRITCQSITIPIEVLKYVLKYRLPWEATLGQPLLIPGDFQEKISGNGYIIALKGAAIEPGVHFTTRKGAPIILREQCTIKGPQEVKAGTLVPPNSIL